MCERYHRSPEFVPTDKYERRTLSDANNYTDTYTAELDSYMCVVATYSEEGVYRYSVKGLVHQYHNVSYLKEQDICMQDYSLIKNLDGNSAELNQSIDRLLDSLLSPEAQHTCILVTVEGYCTEFSKCAFNMTGSIFGTKSNPSVIETSVAASFGLILLALFLVCLCVL